MRSDYEKICEDNRRAYGERGATKIGQLTAQLLYADRTHFIYELLQNAEDALARRGQAWSGKREVAFDLMSDQLRVEHYGDPFTEEDVKAICEFDESTKRESLTDIGPFGIGFKSVYAYTSEPQISSGDEHFAVRDYIFPYSTHPIERVNPDQTAFAISFNSGSSSEYEEIAHGLASLHRRTLLFLKNLEEISWQTDQDRSGQYLRETELIDEGVYRSTLVSRDTNDEDVNQEEWLVFSRTVSREDELAGEVQIAFLVGDNGKSIERSNDCTLFARFATGIETHTGFLMDGPYQTTLSRDDVPSRTSWNRYLVEETAALLIESLRYFRDGESLNAAVLRCLPLLDLSSLPARPLLGPLFEPSRHCCPSSRAGLNLSHRATAYWLTEQGGLRGPTLNANSAAMTTNSPSLALMRDLEPYTAAGTAGSNRRPKPSLRRLSVELVCGRRWR